MFVSAPASFQRLVYFIILPVVFSFYSSSIMALDSASSKVKSNQTPVIKTAALHSSVDEKRLLKRLGNIKTVSAEFIQKLYTSESNEPQITLGSLLVAGGDKFRLEYTKPYEQLYVANGKEFLFYDVDLEQITIKPQSQELANTPAMILSNPALFIKKYYVKINSESYLEEYILSAKSEASAYNKILLSFKNSKLDTMTIEDSFGQETELHFNKIIYNRKIVDSNFNFTPPKGVDVIRSAPDAKLNAQMEELKK